METYLRPSAIAAEAGRAHFHRAHLEALQLPLQSTSISALKDISSG